MSFWLEFESPGCLHEDDPVVLKEFHVTMPKLSDSDDWRWVVAYVQRYESDGKMFWRSLDRQRKIFSRGHATREEAAQKVVAESPVCRSAIAGRRRTQAAKRRSGLVAG